MVYFDPDKLEKIITNLLSNAFKFTPEGGKIIVTARLHPAEEQPISTPITKPGRSSKVCVLELDVRDNGIGIPKDQLAKIFDRFYQTDTSHTREQEGSGIGLSLVRELVELHEGEVIAESQPGEGASFMVRLPLRVADFEELNMVEHMLENGEQRITPFNDDTPYETDALSESVTEGIL